MNESDNMDIIEPASTSGFETEIIEAAPDDKSIISVANLGDMATSLASAKPLLTQNETYLRFRSPGTKIRAIFLGWKESPKKSGDTMTLAKFAAVGEDGGWMTFVHAGTTLVEQLQGVAPKTMVEISLLELKKNKHGGETSIFGVTILGPSAPAAPQVPWDDKRVNAAEAFLNAFSINPSRGFDYNGKTADKAVVMRYKAGLKQIIAGLNHFKESGKATAAQKALDSDSPIDMMIAANDGLAAIRENLKPVEVPF